jgi:Signal transduction histidine kinase involved in nitrogen fixation and metabolism regulation
MIFVEVKNSIRKDINVSGSFANRKYITFFSLFTLIPSLLISIFSLFLFSFALEKYFDKKITSAVNNSYELAKNYVDEVRNKIESDIVLISIDLNKNIETFYNNPKLFQRFLNTQRLIRGVDEIHLVDSSGNIINTTIEDKNNYTPPSSEALEMVFTDERPLKIINTYENKSAALYRLTNYIDTYLYVVKFLDQEISNYLIEAEEALNFYYIVEDRRTGIRISFILIYVVIVSLLLFLSISIAIRFSSRFFTSISNLISASSKIGKGKLNTKVPFIKTDKDLETQNKNFNLMIDRLKDQQEK